jgi:Mor family transcriptional regulator
MIEQLKHIDRRCFPKLINDFIDFLGYEPALKIYATYSGVHLSVPKVNTITGDIERLIGDEAFKKLSLMFGDETLNIPNAVKLLKDREIIKRNDSIYKDWQNGATQATLARHFSITERTVNSIIKTYKG